MTTYDVQAWTALSTKTYDYFIAHSRSLEEFARRRCDLLEDQGYTVFLPCRDGEGNGEAMISANWDGNGPFTNGFNAKYMLRCLALCGEETKIMFQSAKHPMLIEGEATMVLMPIHIKEASGDDNL